MSYSKGKTSGRYIASWKFPEMGEDMPTTNLSEVSSNLDKEYKFRLHNKVYRILRRPRNAAKIFLARMKYKSARSPTYVNTNLFFGRTMRVKLPDGISESLSRYHFWEYELSKILLSELSEGMVFVDVGAHFGYYTLLASSIVRGSGIVHSFEPTKDTYEILLANTAELKNVKTNQLAVWSQEAKLEFYEYGDKLLGLNSFTKPRTKEFSGTARKTTVDAVSLDTYFANIRVPDFVKIDAESAELQVLNGMTGLINRNHPKISLEVGDSNIGSVPTSRECIDFLLDREYDCFEYSADLGKLVPHRIRERYDIAEPNLMFVSNKVKQRNMIMK